MVRKLLVVPAMCVALVFSGFTANVQAAVITTQQAMSAEARAATEAGVRASLARDDVRQAMLQLGADPTQVDGRIASLSDTELMQVQGELDRLPAGGVLAVVGLVFVVLLILELTGVIDIFKRT
jgi:TolA-binding protein